MKEIGIFLVSWRVDNLFHCKVPCICVEFIPVVEAWLSPENAPLKPVFNALNICCMVDLNNFLDVIPGNMQDCGGNSTDLCH
jgi:hypothetical protein